MSRTLLVRAEREAGSNPTPFCSQRGLQTSRATAGGKPACKSYSAGNYRDSQRDSQRNQPGGSGVSFVRNRENPLSQLPVICIPMLRARGPWPETGRGQGRGLAQVRPERGNDFRPGPTQTWADVRDPRFLPARPGLPVRGGVCAHGVGEDAGPAHGVAVGVHTPAGDLGLRE